MVILWILLLAGLAILGNAIYEMYRTAQYRKAALAHYNKLLQSYSADKFFIQPDGFCMIALNPMKKEFLISYSGVDKKIKYTDIVKSEIIVNGQTVSSKSAGSALAGGLLFGTTGAVIGSNMGTTKFSKNIKGVTLKLLVNDVINPAYELVFFQSPTSKDARLAQQNCQSWQDTITVATSQALQTAKP